MTPTKSPTEGDFEVYFFGTVIGSEKLASVSTMSVVEFTVVLFMGFVVVFVVVLVVVELVVLVGDGTHV
jgi:hypothetical protein